tara:strand:- start:2638 stop:3012 length:375 start_codon:yes stop_codon:yes gene_type:complete
MELNILEDGADICKVIQKYVKLPPPGYWSYGTTWESINFPDEYEKPPRDNFEEELQELLVKKRWKEFRKERNRRLAKTDYLFTSDYPHPTPEKKQEWLDYRQALRDLPSTTEDPANPVWPTPPE